MGTVRGGGATSSFISWLPSQNTREKEKRPSGGQAIGVHVENSMNSLAIQAINLRVLSDSAQCREDHQIYRTRSKTFFRQSRKSLGASRSAGGWGTLIWGDSDPEGLCDD